jgi:peroxin-12
MVASSGYVFCYPCAYGYVTDYGCCPVTRFPAGPDAVRKLYEAAQG